MCTLTEQLFMKKILLQYKLSLYIHIYIQFNAFWALLLLLPESEFILPKLIPIEADKFFESTGVCLGRLGTCGCFKKKYRPQWELIWAKKLGSPKIVSLTPLSLGRKIYKKW